MGAGQAAAAAPRQGPYRPHPGSQAEMLLAHLQRHAPHGGEVWLSPAELARSGAKQYAVQTSLLSAIRAGAVSVRGTPQRYQTGPNAPAVLGVVPTLAAERAAPAPAPVPSPRPAAPAPGPAPADEHAAALLRHLDAEIDRMRRALGELARRREQVEMVVTMKGNRA